MLWIQVSHCYASLFWIAVLAFSVLLVLGHFTLFTPQAFKKASKSTSKSQSASKFLSMKTTCLIIFFVVAFAQSLPYYYQNQAIHYRPKYLVLDPKAILECGTYGSNKWRSLKCGRHLIYLPPKASNLELFGKWFLLTGTIVEYLTQPFTVVVNKVLIIRTNFFTLYSRIWRHETWNNWRRWHHFTLRKIEICDRNGTQTTYLRIGRVRSTRVKNAKIDR